MNDLQNALAEISNVDSDSLDEVLIFVEENHEVLIRYFYARHTEACINTKIARVDHEDLWVTLDQCERMRILEFMEGGKIE